MNSLARKELWQRGGSLRLALILSKQRRAPLSPGLLLAGAGFEASSVGVILGGGAVRRPSVSSARPYGLLAGGRDSSIRSVLQGAASAGVAADLAWAGTVHAATARCLGTPLMVVFGHWHSWSPTIDAAP